MSDITVDEYKRKINDNSNAILDKFGILLRNLQVPESIAEGSLQGIQNSVAIEQIGLGVQNLITIVDDIKLEFALKSKAAGMFEIGADEHMEDVN